jgi:rubrerythrin
MKDLGKVDEIRILEIAVEREIIANKFYLDLAAKAHSPEAKEMFLALAKEEELHMKILRAEIDSIGQNGFWFDMQEFTMEK